MRVELARACIAAVVLALGLASAAGARAQARLAEAPRPEGGFVELDGERLYYEVSGPGTGEPVVLCHGYGGNHAIWFQQVLELARDYRVITWDQRGFGRSTNRGGLASTDVFADDLRVLLDHLGIERAHLVGQSMGGWTVVGFALRHAPRVRSLVLSASVGGIFTPESQRAFQAYAAAARGGGAPARPAPLIDPRRAFLYAQIASVAEPPASSIGDGLLRSTQPLDQVRKLRVPALLVSGERDPIFPADSIRAAAAQLRGSRVVEIPLAGHSAYFHQPELWNAIVRAFLGSSATTP
jgi:pimeloyl-ACP methyl ester carboxylesterase